MEKYLLLIVTLFILLFGCEKNISNNIIEKNEQNSNSIKSNYTNDKFNNEISGFYINDEITIEIHSDSNFSVNYNGLNYVSIHNEYFNCWTEDNFCEGQVYLEGTSIYDSNHFPHPISFSIEPDNSKITIISSELFPTVDLIKR